MADAGGERGKAMDPPDRRSPTVSDRANPDVRAYKEELSALHELRREQANEIEDLKVQLRMKDDLIRVLRRELHTRTDTHGAGQGAPTPIWDR
jgi:hypothetical protein